MMEVGYMVHVKSETIIILRNEFQFFYVYQIVNYIGSRAKCMHVNCASDPM